MTLNEEEFRMAIDDRKTVVVEKERSSSGPIIAMVVVVILVLLVIFGLPYLGSGGSASTTNVNVAPTGSGQ